MFATAGRLQTIAKELGWGYLCELTLKRDFCEACLSGGSFTFHQFFPEDVSRRLIAQTLARRCVETVAYRLQISVCERRGIRLAGRATDRQHALREGLYHAATNVYRCRVVKFATEMEGFIPSIGDAIAISHDTPGWGSHGEATAWDDVTLVLRLRGLYDVEIEAVPDDPTVHTADIGVIAPPLRISKLPGTVTKPIVSGLLARRMPDDNARALIAWAPAPGANLYLVEMAEGADPNDPDVSWVRIADTTATHQAVTLLYAAQTLVRVRGLGLAAGPWVAASIGTLISDLWNTDNTPMWTAETR